MWCHTVWKTWLFITYSDERWLYFQFSLPHLYISLQKGWENVLFELWSERVINNWIKLARFGGDSDKQDCSWFSANQSVRYIVTMAVVRFVCTTAFPEADDRISNVMNITITLLNRKVCSLLRFQWNGTVLVAEVEVSTNHVMNREESITRSGLPR